MIKSIIKKFTHPIFCGLGVNGHSPTVRYYCIRNSLFIVMIVITLFPLLISTWVNFIQHKQLLKEDSIANARWNAESARSTITAYLEKLAAAITIMINTHSFQELSDPQQLASIFHQLEKENWGVVDISVIDSDGIQRAYIGPYHLEGKNYKDSVWFSKALAKKIYVSEVFTGFRDVPHFVLAASKKDEHSGEYWILRVSIDTDTLDKFLSMTVTEAIEDAFLVNDKGGIAKLFKIPRQTT